jgi:hypothetical protein
LGAPPELSEEEAAATPPGSKSAPPSMVIGRTRSSSPLSLASCRRDWESTGGLSAMVACWWRRRKCETAAARAARVRSGTTKTTSDAGLLVGRKQGKDGGLNACYGRSVECPGRRTCTLNWVSGGEKCERAAWEKRSPKSKSNERQRQTAKRQSHYLPVQHLSTSFFLSFFLYTCLSIQCLYTSLLLLSNHLSRHRPKSLKTTRAQFLPGAPITPPPGCVPAPHKYRPGNGVRYPGRAYAN